MTIDDFCSVLGFDHAAKHILEDVWEEAARTAPQGIPPFMTMDFCRRYYPHTGGDPELLKRMEEVCRIVAKTPEAAFYAWLLHYSVFHRTPAANFGSLPAPFP